MNNLEVYTVLKSKGFNATLLRNGVLVQSYPRVPVNELAVSDVLEALEYKVNKVLVDAIDNWTLIVYPEPGAKNG